VDKKFVEACHSYLAEIPAILLWWNLKQHSVWTVSPKVQKAAQQRASVRHWTAMDKHPQGTWQQRQLLRTEIERIIFDQKLLDPKGYDKK
jgi:hypothetical protein